MMINIRKLYICVLVFLLALVGCNGKDFTLQGTIAGGEGKTLWVEELSPEGCLFIDSIPLDSEGRFKRRISMPSQSFYNLHTSADNYIVLLPSKGEKVTVEGRWENLSLTYTVEGSSESTLLWELQQQSNKYESVVKDLVDTTIRYAYLTQTGAISKADSVAKKREMDSVFRGTRQEFRDYIYGFIEDNQGSLATLIALYKPFNNKPLISSTDSNCVGWYETVAEGLRTELPNNPHTLHFLPIAERVQMTYSSEQ